MIEGHSWDPSACVVHVLPPAPGSPFRCAIPEGWERLPVVSEEPDYSDPTAFMPLGAFMVDAGSMIITVAGRPAFETGSPAQWLPYLCRHLGFEPELSCPIRGTGHRTAASCHASQATSRGPMEIRLALFEERGQWILLTAMAVHSRLESLEPTFLNLMESFELQDVPARAPARAQLGSIVPFPAAARTTHLERPRIVEPLHPSFRFATS